MKNVIIYDNGGITIDRYTAVYKDWPGNKGLFQARAMSAYPFHPQGFGQMCEALIGPHLGKRIAFKKLPIDCQQLIKQDRS